MIKNWQWKIPSGALKDKVEKMPHLRVSRGFHGILLDFLLCDYYNK